MTFAFVALLVVAMVLGAYRVRVSRLRSIIAAQHEEEELAVSAIMARIGNALPPGTSEGEKYMVAARLVYDVRMESVLAGAPPPDDLVALSLAYVAGAIHQNPTLLSNILLEVRPKPKDLSAIHNVTYDPSAPEDRSYPLLRIMDDATDLVERELARKGVAPSPRAVRLCAAQCVQLAVNRSRGATTDTVHVVEHALGEFEESVSRFGSFANAVSALSAERESRLAARRPGK